MNKYYIEQRLRTLIENAVFPISNSEEPFFEIDGIKFKQWDFSNEHGWRGHSWLLSYITSAKSGAEAYREFHEKISKIIPRISLVGQSYTSIYAQSFIISCKSNNITYFRHVKKEDPVGLMFIENEFKALSILMKDNKIPQDFYLFWNDAINTTGYASKMLVMSTAILAIAKKSNGKIDHDLIAEILGEDLREKIFGQKVGLRHRLSHGEYFKAEDHNMDYVRIMHEKVMNYFNNVIIGEPLISLDVTSPQRNFIGNYSSAGLFIRPNKSLDLSLRGLIEEFEKNDSKLNNLPYTFLSSDEVGEF